METHRFDRGPDRRRVAGSVDTAPDAGVEGRFRSAKHRGAPPKPQQRRLDGVTGAWATEAAWRPTPWFIATSLLFTFAYGLANRLTSLREDIGLGVFAWERAIPFIGWTIVPYLSIFAFFAASFFVDTDAASVRRHVLRLLLVLGVSLVCYVAFPLRFTFDRPTTEGVVGLLFGLLSAFDLPYNRAPSLHIGVLAVLWVQFAPRLQGWARAALHLWFGLIALSVLTTYQHHVLDVPAGAALGAFAIAVTARRRREDRCDD